MEQATLSGKFQIVIPKRIREEMGLKAGQKFVFVPKGHLLTLVPMPDPASLRGIMRGANTTGYRDRFDVDECPKEQPEAD
jgi:AbrB family looped-hinge helix DNA binding protein